MHLKCVAAICKVLLSIDVGGTRTFHDLFVVDTVIGSRSEQACCLDRGFWTWYYCAKVCSLLTIFFVVSVLLRRLR